MVELSGGRWGIWWEDTKRWTKELASNQIYFSRAKMIELGWEDYIKAEPIWTAETKEQPPPAEPKRTEPPEPSYYPFDSAEDKEHYYWGG